MSFLHPWAIAIGIVAAAAPLAIHLLTRPRPVRLPLSTLRFVRAAVRQQRARHRLRDLVILALRTAAVLLLAVAVARPRWGDQPLVNDARPGDAVRVVLFDVSLSMGARDHDIERVERARTIAAELLRYRPGLRANLILAAAAPRAVFEQPSTNFGALRAELAGLSVRPERIDVVAALEEAGRLLAPRGPDDSARRELVVVSDFQRANWARADFTVLPKGTNIQLESVASEPMLDNVAILRAEARPAGAQGGAVEIEVEVANYSPAPRKATVEVVFGPTVWRQEAVLPAGAPVTLTDQLDMRGTGWRAGRASLVGIDDALPADNARGVVVQFHGKPHYLLVTRQRPEQRPSSSHYLQCALMPGAGGEEDASGGPRLVEPSRLDATAVSAADVVLLDHPGLLPEESISLLAGLLRRGRPIVYVAAEPVDATNLQRLGEAAGGGLRMPVEFVPPPAGAARRDLFLAAVDERHPAFAVFGDQLDVLTGRLRFAGGLATRRRDQGLADDVLATYSDGSACLVVTVWDAGTLAVVNADLATSNLTRSPVFVPLVEELLGQVMRQGRGARRPAVCGEPLVAQLPPESGSAADLRVAPAHADSPGPEGSFGRLAEESAGVVWHWPAPPRPEVYEVRRGDEVVFAQAIDVPPDESLLESLRPEVLTERLAAGRAVYFAGATGRHEQRNDAWTWLAVGCVVCLLGELTALYAFRT
ncbi:MAG: BatA domain-containing protein [Pirellulales bacterium]